MSYGLRVYGPNGSSLVLDEAMRHKRIINQMSFHIPPGQWQDFNGIPDVQDFNKVSLVVSQWEDGIFSPWTGAYGSQYENIVVGFNNSSSFYIYNSGDRYNTVGDVVVVRVG
jgi:hypothetical protein